MALTVQKFVDEAEETDNGTPVRYVPLRHLYSATSPCVSASGSSNVMSKKVKARKLIESFDSDLEKIDGGCGLKQNGNGCSSIVRVYRRQAKKPRSGLDSVKKPCFYDSVIRQVGSEGASWFKLVKPRESDEAGNGDIEEQFLDVENSRESESDRFESCEEHEGGIEEAVFEGISRGTGSGIVQDSTKAGKDSQKRKANHELLSLGSNWSFFRDLDGAWTGESRVRKARATMGHLKSNSAGLKKCNFSGDHQKSEAQRGSGSVSVKRWVSLNFQDVDPMTFVGFTCKVYWPLDDDWYAGSITSYNPETKQHHVKYDDGDHEDIFLLGEKIKFYLSREEIQRLNLKCSGAIVEKKPLDYDEMVVLAASFDDCNELEPGDIIWAKLTGHAMWPAVVMDETRVPARKGLQAVSGERSLLVQFFGTHDFARINVKQVISFLRGLLSSFQLKCKQSRFHRSMEEAKRYLREQKLPDRMVRLQNGIGADDCESGSGEEDETSDSSEDDIVDEGGVRECSKSFPFEIGDLRVISLGKIVKDSEYFHNERYIWPEGYTTERKFMSTKNPSTSNYRMEVLRDPKAKAWPLFRVTLDNGEQINGSTPVACWKKIYARINKVRNNLCNGYHAEKGRRNAHKSGTYMFGFSNQQVSRLIQELPNSRLCSKYFGSKFTSGNFWDLPAGYRPVRVDWKDLDRCSVCHMDEEYENNLFLQCDKCRMMVHARCYGELEPSDGLWLCNLCRPGATRSPPPCCLCPVTGGAMKPTTDGRWAHLTCAMWIPETCLLDIKRMEPIDGLNRINRDRWKLLCSICGVSYGACIQCSNSTCRVAYHPLCARAAGLCVELEDEDKLHLMSIDEDDDQCIRLLSFCKKHRQPTDERSPADEEVGQAVRYCSSYTPPSNPSGCARSEPYDFLARRGRKEPEALAAASVKRLYVENKPYLVSGYRQNGSFVEVPSCNELVLTSFSKSLQKLEKPQLASPRSFVSMAEKYKYMRDTFRKRLAFGKSGIHGFGIFAKQPHRAGDMVIEYTGELVRPPIADIREHLIYNSLVGAGTYMFRIDDERVIDATRAGSIAHLINHSCEPNCYSRVISVNADEHIIIFAKRDISRWEELTYDYRFFSIDEQLACYCGFPRCRGVVNDIEAEEQMAKICVPRRELIDWRED